MNSALKIILCMAFVSPLIAGRAAQAAEGSTCKVSTNDIGKIVGRGRSQAAAFEDAATQCFDRRELLYKLKNHGNSVDEGNGIAMIDDCANIKCGS